MEKHKYNKNGIWYDKKSIKDFYQLFNDNYNLLSNKTILDCGCNIGIYSHILAQPKLNNSIIAIDNNPILINKWKHKPNIKWINTNLFKYKYKNTNIDIIFFPCLFQDIKYDIKTAIFLNQFHNKILILDNEITLINKFNLLYQSKYLKIIHKF